MPKMGNKKSTSYSSEQEENMRTSFRSSITLIDMGLGRTKENKNKREQEGGECAYGNIMVAEIGL